MLLEFFAKHIVQPCRDIFEKAIGLAVTRLTRLGFLACFPTRMLPYTDSGRGGHGFSYEA